MFRVWWRNNGWRKVEVSIVGSSEAAEIIANKLQAVVEDRQGEISEADLRAIRQRLRADQDEEADARAVGNEARTPALPESAGVEHFLRDQKVIEPRHTADASIAEAQTSSAAGPTRNAGPSTPCSESESEDPGISFGDDDTDEEPPSAIVRANARPVGAASGIDATAGGNATERARREMNAATASLVKMRMSRVDVVFLRHLLELRADPNVRKECGASLLRYALLVAPNYAVGATRKLLLSHGALETDDDKQYWLKRRVADSMEKPWLERFHDDPRT